MARYHYWQFLVNQEGQPINNAEISIYLAGTETPAYVYRSEFGDDVTDTTPQVYTNKSGYFEFWLADTEETEGYPIGQKFKLQWFREGISNGSIDWIDIYPGFAPVDETDEQETTKNKLVSNVLAKGWEDHSTWNVNSEGVPIHGIDRVDETDESTNKNKLVSNLLAKQWNELYEDYIDWRDPQEEEIYPRNIRTGKTIDHNEVIGNIVINAEDAYLHRIKPVDEITSITIEDIDDCPILLHVDNTNDMPISTDFTDYITDDLPNGSNIYTLYIYKVGEYVYTIVNNTFISLGT